MNDIYKKSISEAQHQVQVFEWAKIMQYKYKELALMYHVANEGKRTARNGANLVKQGLCSGIPDIVLPVARNGYHGLYIELKKIGGKFSGETGRNQKWWIEQLNHQGYKAVVCYGAEDAQRTIENYLTATGE